MPDEAEVRGLLALLRLQDARRGARLDAAGDLVPLEDQDRRRWDRPAIDEGAALALRALAAPGFGACVLQAAIAALHGEAATAAATDWPQIVGLHPAKERPCPRLIPYLSFNGRCREAMQFYERALDARVLAVMTQAEMPRAADAAARADAETGAATGTAAPAAGDGVVHACLPLSGGALLYGADSCGEPWRGVHGVSLTREYETVDEAHGAFHALARGGRVRCRCRRPAQLAGQRQLLAAEPLHPVETATTVRVRGGRVTLFEGPFAETKEQLAGFYLVEARDLNEAIRLAAGIPPAAHGSIEVRPVRVLDAA